MAPGWEPVCWGFPQREAALCLRVGEQTLTALIRPAAVQSHQPSPAGRAPKGDSAVQGSHG